MSIDVIVFFFFRKKKQKALFCFAEGLLTQISAIEAMLDSDRNIASNYENWAN
jgi:hypothetical protein